MGSSRSLGFILVATLVAGLPAVAQSDEDCLMCHEDAENFEGLENAERLAYTAEAHAATLHGEVGLACIDCHQDLAEFDDFPHEAKLPHARCTPCHEDVQETFDVSVHGYALERGFPRAPSCGNCHGVHEILPSSEPESPVHRANLPETCAACHGTVELENEDLIKRPRPFGEYELSVHGHGDKTLTAICTDCHGVHDLRGAGDPDSRVHRVNLSHTCGQCHEDVAAEYDASIHGLALAAGVSDSPTCTDCHGEHLILPPTDSDSRVYSRRQAQETCGACHNDPQLIAKYRLKGGVVGSYVDSYHGWASRSAYESSATCVSCHTAHGVLPEKHPDSTVHADNVVDTCRNCHPTADARFAASYTHAAVSITENPINRWIRNAYVIMIVAVIGGMLLHNLVILNYYAVESRRRSNDERCIRRMDRSQIVQHMLLTVSFTGLVITGFALRFPEAWWVSYLSALGMTEPIRADTHRVFAVILVVGGLYHVYYLIATRRGRGELLAIAPSLLDVRQAIQNLAYYTWRRKEHVDFRRYDYTQKAEYWALIWGTVVMAFTGFILWFPEIAVRFLPSWTVTAAQTVHYYEAWLATLAILVWHFFFVMFHPEVYPMSWIWISGKMNAQAASRHHPQWVREEMASAESEPPETKRAENASADAEQPREESA